MRLLLLTIALLGAVALGPAPASANLWDVEWRGTITVDASFTAIPIEPFCTGSWSHSGQHTLAVRPAQSSGGSYSPGGHATAVSALSATINDTQHCTLLLGSCPHARDITETYNSTIYYDNAVTIRRRETDGLMEIIGGISQQFVVLGAETTQALHYTSGNYCTTPFAPTFAERPHPASTPLLDGADALPVTQDADGTLHISGSRNGSYVGLDGHYGSWVECPVVTCALTESITVNLTGTCYKHAGADLGDNDADGIPNGCDLTPGSLVCQDGFDNDYDGRVDHPADKQCESAEDGTETAHYRIEARAWIPFAHVADPELLFNAPLGTYSQSFVEDNYEGCLNVPFLQWPFVSARGLYRGDDHFEFHGPTRAEGWVEFDWTGDGVSNVTQGSTISVSHRDAEFLWPTGGITCEHSAASPLGTVTAAPINRGALIEIDAKTTLPILPSVFTPAITASWLTAIVDEQETIRLNYQHDAFPAHGYRAWRDGKLLVTLLTNDLRCLPQDAFTGPEGPLRLFVGLAGLLPRSGTFTFAKGSTADQLVYAGRLCGAPLAELALRLPLILAPSAGRELAAAVPVQVAELPKAGAKPSFKPLETAVKVGLVDMSRHGRQLTLRAGVPLLVRVPAGTEVTARSVGGAKARARQWTASGGALVVRLDEGVPAATKNGKPVAGRPPDTKPPVTTVATVRLRGGRVRLKLTVNDASSAQTWITLDGRRLVRYRAPLVVRAAKLGVVRFFSLDVHGNRERPRRVG